MTGALFRAKTIPPADSSCCIRGVDFSSGVVSLFNDCVSAGADCCETTFSSMMSGAFIPGIAGITHET
ncbi:MAG: hypothetical protein PHC33_00155 [Candidatus Omnitrophica bacterium]|nr:hypothetical protein [Candidatus Omnitrophota bacterium]